MGKNIREIMESAVEHQTWEASGPVDFRHFPPQNKNVSHRCPNPENPVVVWLWLTESRHVCICL